MEITKREERDRAMEQLLDLVLAPLPRKGEPAPVCIDCYRDGGCREHSQPDDGEVNER